MGRGPNRGEKGTVPPIGIGEFRKAFYCPLGLLLSKGGAKPGRRLQVVVFTNYSGRNKTVVRFEGGYNQWWGRSREKRKNGRETKALTGNGPRL
jgi:hypothetical protein